MSREDILQENVEISCHQGSISRQEKQQSRSTYALQKTFQLTSHIYYISPHMNNLAYHI